MSKKRQKVAKNSGSRKKRRIISNRANIKVIGVGGGGGNAVSRMREDFIKGIEFIAVNTDVQDLDFCNADKKIAIGKTVTRGLGTGMDPELGRKAAEENKEEIAEVLQGADLVFITAGLGGGTGSGASVVVAEIARGLGALTVAVVTKPFSFEGGQRMKIAEEALQRLKEQVDTHIIVPNDRIFAFIGQDTSISKAFEAIDNILRNAVQGIAELIAMPGIINVDFADVKTIMKGSGEALVGIGSASGKGRDVNSVRQVLDFPLLDVSIDGAKGILFGISGGRDLKMTEINEIAKLITENADAAAKIIFGAYYDRKLGKGRIKVTMIATNFGPNNLSHNGNGADFEIKTNPLFPLKTEKKETQELKESRETLIERPKISESNINKFIKLNNIEKDEKNEKNNKKKPPEIWDIPAFLRRNKK